MQKEETQGLDERWELASRAANEGIWDWDLRTNKVYRSAYWFEMFGYEPGELADTPWVWENMIHPDDAASVIEQRGRHIEGRAPRYYAEHRMRCKDGRYRWFLSRGQVIRDEEGTPIRMLGFYTNIDETIASRMQILRQNAVLKALNEVSLQAIGNETHDATLTAILNGIRGFMEADKGYLSILDHQSDLMQTHSLSGSVGPTIMTHRRGEHLTGLVWASGKFQYIADFSQWPGRPPTEDSSQIIAAAGIPLQVGETIVGVVILGFGCQREILAEEVEILQQFAVIAALVVRNREMALQLKEDFRLRTLLEKVQPIDRVSFLNALAEGKPIPARELAAQAKLFDLPPKSGYITLVAHSALSAARFSEGLIRVEEENKMNIWSRERKLYILYPLAQPEHERLAISHRVEEVRQQLELLLACSIDSLGVGLHCASLREVATGFRQAREALEIGSRLHPKRAVHHYLDIGLLQVLSKTGDKDQVDVFVTHMIGVLIDHDRKKNSHLVETLAAILSGATLRSVADELFIHIKTLMFRKHHIEKLLGESLEDASVRMNLTLALQLHELSGEK